MDKRTVSNAFLDALVAVLSTRFPSIGQRQALVRARHDAMKVLDKQSYDAMVLEADRIRNRLLDVSVSLWLCPTVP